MRQANTNILSLGSFLETQGVKNGADIKKVLESFKPLTTKRNQILISQGEICHYLYYIQSGCLRLYELDQHGNQITSYFAFEESMVTALASFITEKPSLDFLLSHEPSSVLRIRREDFFVLVLEIKGFSDLYNRMVQFAFIHAQMRIYSFLGMDAIDKLRWVIEHEPKLLTRISSKAVASYLGITNSTLSKLKSKL